jgi:hypothetical protein
MEDDMSYRSIPRFVRKLTGIMGDLRRFNEVPHVIFRCDKCGTKVGASQYGQMKASDKAAFSCPEDGQLEEDQWSLDDIHKEWERLGRPNKLNLRLKVVQ